MLKLIRKETGEAIVENVRSISAGMMAIKVNEDEDREINAYKPGRYDLVNRYGQSVIYKRICAACGKEIKGDAVRIIPEKLDANGCRIGAMDEKQVNNLYCTACTLAAIKALNGSRRERSATASVLQLDDVKAAAGG